VPESAGQEEVEGWQILAAERQATGVETDDVLVGGRGHQAHPCQRKQRQDTDGHACRVVDAWEGRAGSDDRLLVIALLVPQLGQWMPSTEAARCACWGRQDARPVLVIVPRRATMQAA